MEDEASWQIIHEFRKEAIRLELAMASPSASSHTEMPSPRSQAQAPSAQEQAFQQARAQLFPQTPIDAISRSLVSGRFSDLTIIHGDRKWNAHKVVVGSQSSVLESQITAADALSKAQDVTSLNLSSYDEETVVKMIEYLYTGSYTTFDEAPAYSVPLHTKVFLLSAKLKIYGLAELASSQFRTALADRVQALDIYFTSIMEVYAKTNVETSVEFPQLRQAVIEVAVIEMARLLGEPNVRRKFLEIFNARPEFLGDVLEALSVRGENAVEIHILCEECGPRVHDPYDIEFICRSCKKDKRLVFL